MAVDVAVKEIRGPVPVDEPPIGPKPPVARIFGIVNKSRRCVRHHDVHTPPPPDRRTKREQPPAHFRLRVLTRPAIVPPRALNAEDIQLAKPNAPEVDIRASRRRAFLIADIVIAAHIKQRHVQGGR